MLVLDLKEWILNTLWDRKNDLDLLFHLTLKLCHLPQLIQKLYMQQDSMCMRL